ncbi:MAG: hypothetical protein AAB447_03210 [Patescibacteria group bacterium]
MKLKQTAHFQSRLSERNINFEHIKQAIRCPDSKELVFDGKIRVSKRIEGKLIEVIYCKESFRDKEEYLLITAYYK